MSEPSNLFLGIETLGGTEWEVVIKEKSPGGIDINRDLPNPIYKLSRIALALEKFEKEILKKMKVPETYDKNMSLDLLTYQIYSGGSDYLETGAVPVMGHIYFWFGTFSYMKENEVKKILDEYMKEELSKYNDFKDYFPSFKNIIRFMDGHKTNTDHPAMSSIRKSYKKLKIKCEEKG
ncbi:unnamed protein product, partial [marine sediment metagenome]